MPYKIILQGDHGGVLDDATAKTEADLKAKLHEMVDDTEFVSGDHITILSMSDVEVPNEAYWNNMLEEIRRR